VAEKSLPSKLTTSFFRCLAQRSLPEAERQLKHIRDNNPSTEWESGYLKAMEGMLLSLRKTDDRYAFIRAESLEECVKRLEQEFASFSEGMLHSEFDRGFFAAWRDYIRALRDTGLSNEDLTLDNRPSKRRVSS